MEILTNSEKPGFFRSMPSVMLKAKNWKVVKFSNVYQRVADRMVRAVGQVPSSLNNYFAENRPVCPKVVFKIQRKMLRIILPRVSKLWTRIKVEISAYNHIFEKNDIAYGIVIYIVISSVKLFSCKIERFLSLYGYSEGTTSKKIASRLNPPSRACSWEEERRGDVYYVTTQ